MSGILSEADASGSRLSQLESAWDVNLLVAYVRIAATSLLVYDYITTIEEEVHYFWGVRGQLATWVFFLNRYIGLFAAFVATINDVFLNLSTSLGDTELDFFGGWTDQIAGWLGIILIDCILLMRVSALCHNDKRTRCFLKILFVAKGIVTLGLLLHIETVLLSSIGSANGPFDRLSATLYWLLPLSFELVLLAVAVYKTTIYWRVPGELSRFSLVSVLLRDQVTYFFIVIACSIASISVYWMDDGLYKSLVAGLANSSLLCLLGSHLLFNLKEAAERDSNEYSDRGASTISEMRFN